MIYASEHQSLAALDVRVHIDKTRMRKLYKCFSPQLDERLREVFRVSRPSQGLARRAAAAAPRVGLRLGQIERFRNPCRAECNHPEGIQLPHQSEASRFRQAQDWPARKLRV
jgi:hypothetical protein